MSLIVSGANRHDSVCLDELLASRVVKQEDMMPKGKEEEEVKREDMTAKGEGEQEREEEHLCLDAGYTGREAIVKKHGFIPHIRPRGEEKQLIKKNPSYKARRWGVEACHSWFKETLI